MPSGHIARVILCYEIRLVTGEYLSVNYVALPPGGASPCLTPDPGDGAVEFIYALSVTDTDLV